MRPTERDLMVARAERAKNERLLLVLEEIENLHPDLGDMIRAAERGMDKITQQTVNKMYGEEVNPLDRAHREGMIAGLELAAKLASKRANAGGDIRAEIERLKREQS